MLTLCPKCRHENKFNVIEAMGDGFGCPVHGLTTVKELYFDDEIVLKIKAVSMALEKIIPPADIKTTVGFIDHD